MIAVLSLECQLAAKTPGCFMNFRIPQAENHSGTEWALDKYLLSE